MLLALLRGGTPASAQGWVGLGSSNYGGTNTLYFNPSSIADSRFKFYLNVGGADIIFFNTYLRFDLPRGPLASSSSISSNNLQEQLTGGTKFASISGEARLPSLMLSLGKDQSFAFTNRVRGFIQASNVSENVARLVRYGLAEADRLGLANHLLEDNRFNLAANSYHEFAFSYARAFTPNTTHFFKGGLTVKYLVGLGGAYLLNEGLQYQVYNRDSVQVPPPALATA